MRLNREPAEYFYGRCLRVDPRWAMPPPATERQLFEVVAPVCK